MKVLVIRFSSIGDIVLCSPVFRCLKEQVKDVEIHFVTRSGYVPLVSHNPHIHKIHVLEEKASLKSLIGEIRKEKFDFILDLHHNWRSALVKLGLSGVPSSTFYKMNLKKWLYVYARKDWLGNQHVVNRYLETASCLNVLDDEKGLEMHLSPQAMEWAGQHPAALRQDFDALIIGARQGTKRPTPTLLENICKGTNRPFVLIGGTQDRAMGEALEQIDPSRLWNCAGLAGLQQSAALIRLSRRVISPDTGMMHIASAFGKPICSIWGNTDHRLGMFPYFGSADLLNTAQTPRDASLKKLSADEDHSSEPDLLGNYLNSGGMLAEVNGLSCRPCAKIGFKRCPRGHFRCMKDQNSQAILDWLHRE